jgi:predicted  nucleic acid-binding Zn-ribbon protein
VARVDLDDMVAGVGVRLVELAQVRLELDEMRDGTEAARVNAYLGRLAEAFESVADRVMAMHEYLEHLRALDQQLIALDHSERTRAMGERVLDIVSRTAGDDTVGAQFRDLNLEAESHAESIARLLADLDHTAEEFDDLDAQIQKAEEAGAQEGSADRPQPAALTAEADPAARIERFLDRKRESPRNESHER